MAGRPVPPYTTLRLCELDLQAHTMGVAASLERLNSTVRVDQSTDLLPNVVDRGVSTSLALQMVYNSSQTDKVLTTTDVWAVIELLLVCWIVSQLVSYHTIFIKGPGLGQLTGGRVQVLGQPPQDRELPGAQVSLITATVPHAVRGFEGGRARPTDEFLGNPAMEIP
jgi:hypothetical protein